MLVKTILKGKMRGGGLVTVPPDITIAEAARVLTANRIGALIAVDHDGHIAGILSERDIVRGMAANHHGCADARVRDLMTAAVRTCHIDDPLESLMQIMTARRIRHLPVVDDDGQLVGMVTIGDVVKCRLEQADMDVENLRHYVAAVR